jgi:hypothetical protein
MLASASPLVAGLLIAGAVALVAALIIIGMRQRLELEIPPKRWAEPPPISTRCRRERVAFFTLTQVCLVLGVAGALAHIGWLIGLGLGAFAAAYLIRIWITVRWAIRARRKGWGSNS